MITIFKITDTIELAECSVPRIMITFGQNGVGKSTFLYAVKQNIMDNVMGNECYFHFSTSMLSETRIDNGTNCLGYVREYIRCMKLVRAKIK